MLPFGSCSPGTSFGTDFTLFVEAVSVISPLTVLGDSPKSKSFTYNFSFWSQESLWPLFSSITLETPDETHSYYWWDQTCSLPVKYYKGEFSFHMYYKQRDTHCLSNDAGDARFSSEPRQALETTRKTTWANPDMFAVWAIRSSKMF